MDTFKKQNNENSSIMSKKVKITSPIDELKKAQRSEQTLDRYQYYVRKFCEFSNITPAKLLTFKDEAIRTLQKNYLVHLNEKKLSRSYIAGIVSGLDKFLIMNEREGARLTEKMRDSLLPQSREQQQSGRGAWDEHQIKLMMESTKNIQTKAILGILASTGGRLGTIVENVKGNDRYLTTNDIVDDANKHKFVGQGREIEKIEFGNCKTIRCYAETGLEYWNFLTPSASRYLDKHLQSRRLNEIGFRENPEGKPLFVKKDKKTGEIKPMTYSDVKHAVQNVIKKVRGTLEEGKKRHQIQLTNGFRHRFVDKCIEAGISPLAISKLMSHSGGAIDILNARGFAINKIQVKNYQTSVKTLFEEWLKALPYLEYDNSAVDKAELDRAQEIIKNQNEFIGKKALEQDKKIEKLQNTLQEFYKFVRTTAELTEANESKEGYDDFRRMWRAYFDKQVTAGSKKLSEHNDTNGEGNDNNTT
ncbi:MAG: site-specific integrase [Thaumarchaeota archaeon]|nr:site-specific integrase [Nitrososphaerota archaeon]